MIPLGREELVLDMLLGAEVRLASGNGGCGVVCVLAPTC
jgi:hypothetical protein